MEEQSAARQGGPATAGACDWYRDGERLLCRIAAAARLAEYQLQLIAESPEAALIPCRRLVAYSGGLLLYDLSRARQLEAEALSLHDCLCLLLGFCALRRKLRQTFLEVPQLILQKELLFAARDEEEPGATAARFLYLPLADRASRELARREQSEALIFLVERAALLAAREGRLSSAEAAAWLHSACNDEGEFEERCLRLAETLPGPPAGPERRGAELRRSAAGEQVRTVRGEAGPARTREARFGRAVFAVFTPILAGLLCGNLLLYGDFMGSFPLRLPLALLALSGAAVAAAAALLHPSSPFRRTRTRFQRERELPFGREGEAEAGENRAVEAFGAWAGDAGLGEGEAARADRFPAYLFAVPSTQGEGLRAWAELSETEPEALILGARLNLGSDPVQADLSLGYPAEAALHSRIRKELGTHLFERLDAQTELAVDGKALPDAGAVQLPRHCLLRIGPRRLEFYSER